VTSPAPAPSPAAEPAAVTLAFAGDVHAEGPSGDAIRAGLPSIRDALGRADLTVVNLETAVTDRGTAADKEFAFRAPASTLPALKDAGVDVVSLANNHGLDFGREGLVDTLAAARAAGMPLVGLGEDEDAAYAAHVAEVEGQRIAVLGATQVLDGQFVEAWTARGDSPGMASAKRAERLVEEVRRVRADADTVVVYLHWGEERNPCPLPRQQELAQQLVDAGADVVVGGHAHVLLGGGMLGEAYVDYGLGNFVFTGSRREETLKSGILTLTVRGRSVEAGVVDAGRPALGCPPPARGGGRAGGRRRQGRAARLHRPGARPLLSVERSGVAGEAQRAQAMAGVPGGADDDDDEQDRSGRPDGGVGAELLGARADDALGQHQRPLLDAERLSAGDELADERLPDQRVQQADDHRVARDHRQQQEQGAVAHSGRGRADGEADSQPVGGAGEHQSGDQRGQGAEHEDDGDRDEQLGHDHDVTAQRLGQQVDDRAVVDLRADGAGAGQQAEQGHDGAEREAAEHERPTAARPARERACATASGQQDRGQREQQQRPTPPSRLPAVSRATVGVDRLIRRPGRRRRSRATRPAGVTSSSGCRGAAPPGQEAGRRTRGRSPRRAAPGHPPGRRRRRSSRARRPVTLPSAITAAGERPVVVGAHGVLVRAARS
jgi:poly-gamma-glutamate synthesis protein (capsule biosynthesis protein)